MADTNSTSFDVLPMSWQHRTYNHYLGSDHNYSELTKEEEADLFLRMQADPLKLELRETITRQYIRLIVDFIVNAQRHYKIKDPEDLVIQIVESMWRNVVFKFDVKKGFRFTTYFTYWMRRELQRFVKLNDDVIAVPIWRTDQYHKLNRCRLDELRRNGIEPTVGKIADMMGISEDKVAEIDREQFLLKNLLSLDRKLNVRESRKNDMHEAVHAREKSALVGLIEKEELSGILTPLLDGLEDHEIQFLIMAHSVRENRRSYTIREIAEELGVSLKDVAAIRQEAVQKIGKNAKKMECQVLPQLPFSVPS